MMSAPLNSYWLASIALNHGGAQMSSLGVARIPQRLAAKSALRQLLQGRGLDGEIELLGSSLDIQMHDAEAMASALKPGEATIRGFGWDNPRDLTERAAPDVNQPGLQGSPRPPGQIADLLFAPADRTDSKATCPAIDHVYAVLDAASVFGLPEILENSGLEHDCLYAGKAARDYGASAPWLVRLSPDHALTRWLLDSGSSKPLGWDAAPGLLIRSPLSLRGLRRQFRRFTMIHNSETQKRLYFRFYDPRVFRTVIIGARPDLVASFMQGIRMIACPDEQGLALIFSRP